LDNFGLVLYKKKESDDYSSDSFKKWRLPTLSLRLFLLLALHSQASLPLLSLRASDPLGIAVQILLPFAPMVQLQKPHIVTIVRVLAAISKERNEIKSLIITEQSLDYNTVMYPVMITAQVHTQPEGAKSS